MITRLALPLFCLLLAPWALGQDEVPALPVTPLAEVVVTGVSEGEGVVDLILIPGIGLSHRAWQPWMEANADRYRMHAVTLPGMAGTAPPPLPDPPVSDTPFLDNAVSAIALYIEEEGLDRPAVIGHGTGGMVAMLVGVRHPELVRATASITMPPAVPIGRNPIDEPERLAHAFGIVQPRNATLDQRQAAISMRGTYQSVLPPGRLRDEVLYDAGRCEPHVLTRYWPEVVSMDLIDEIAANEDLPVLVCLPGRGPFRMADVWHAIADACDSIMLVEFGASASFCHYDEPERFDAALGALIERASLASDAQD